jgi:thiamine-phosphate pyrophosphorylase
LSQGTQRLSNRPQAYLIVDAGPDAPNPQTLGKAIRRTNAACVLLRPPVDAVTDLGKLKPLVEAIQAAECAALIADDAKVALELGADGVHLAHQDDPDQAETHYRAARAILGAGRIVGAGCGLARHNAMVLAELGADYVAFGGAPGCEPAAQLEMVQWWAELFSVPCVAWSIGQASDVGPLVDAGADFIAAGPRGGFEAAVAALARLTQTEGATP